MSVALLVSRGAFLTLAGVACHLWRCSALLVFYLALFGVACLCWRCLSLFDVVRRCSASLVFYVALLAFAGVACRSLTLFSVASFLLGVIWRCLPLLALLVAL